MAEVILQAKHLGISFGGLKAVDDFNIEIKAGELMGLIGPNGAGKTTVFNLLTGVYTPTEGAFFLCGEKMNGKKTYQVVQAGIARTFQNIRLFKSMTVIENVMVAYGMSIKYKMPGTLFRSSTYWREEAEYREKAMELLKIFGLEDKADFVADNLPYGQQRKLEIARALATGMKLLLLDEPAAGMNPNETEALMDMIRFVRDHFNMTVLLIEHDMRLVSGICEELTVLNFGEVLAQGRTSDVLHNPQVITAYLGE